jgi:hypothetical protein
MIKTAAVLILLVASTYGNSPGPAFQPDTSLNTTEFCGKIGIVTCPKPADVKAVKGRSCRTSKSVMKEIMEKITKCKYLLDSKKEISVFKGNANVFFQITSDGYIVNYKVVKTDIKPKSIVKEIEDQIKSIQFVKTEARDCVSEITCTFKLKILTMKKNCPK